MLRDADIREPLFFFLEEEYGKNRIIEEKAMGKSRADVVMITEDAIYGLEIKSDADTYVRLESQVKDYDKFYDYNYVVVGSSHAAHIKEYVPDYWGIITVDELNGQPDFYIYRQPESNPKVKLKKQMSILWKPELSYIQAENNMPKYKDKSKDFVIGKILERTELPEGHKNRIELSDLKKQISYALFERDYEHASEMLKEYRKGELQKQIEAEEDPDKKAELVAALEKKRAQAAENGLKNTRRRYRRRRKHL